MRKLTPSQEKGIRRRVQFLRSKQDHDAGRDLRPFPVSGFESCVFLGRRVYFRRTMMAEHVHEVLVAMFKQACSGEKVRLYERADQSQIERAFLSISTVQVPKGGSQELTHKLPQISG